MSTTRFSDAITGLLAAYQAAPALAGITVYDGIEAQAASSPTFVVVGHDGTLEADGTLTPDALAGTYTQRWIDTGSPREEDGYINCVLVCQTGDATDTAGRRAQAATLLAALEDAAAASGGFAGGVTHMTFDGTTDGRWIYRQSLAGVAVIVAYRVSYSTAW